MTSKAASWGAALNEGWGQQTSVAEAALLRAPTRRAAPLSSTPGALGLLVHAALSGSPAAKEFSAR
jgi:hypothetical protein